MTDVRIDFTEEQVEIMTDVKAPFDELSSFTAARQGLDKDNPFNFSTRNPFDEFTSMRSFTEPFFQETPASPEEEKRSARYSDDDESPERARSTNSSTDLEQDIEDDIAAQKMQDQQQESRQEHHDTKSETLRTGHGKPERVGKPYDIFLSHNWGLDAHKRDNHARVKALDLELKKRGIKTWYDECDMEGNILDAMGSGLDQSNKVIIFITEEYIKKAKGLGAKGTMDNVYREFNYISNHFQTYNMLPIVMEDGVKDLSKWRGAFGLTLIGQLYSDFSRDEGLRTCAEKVQAFTLENRRIQYEDGSIYEGPVNGKMQRHGFGKLIDICGNVYEGNFKDGKKQDPDAKMFYSESGVTFQGRFDNDRLLPDIRGSITLKCGMVMKGSFRATCSQTGMFDGKDVTIISESTGNVYNGSIKSNRIEGSGIMNYKTGDVYKGKWKKWKKHGEGKMTYQNGDVYFGQWKKDMRHGVGTMEMKSNDSYVGLFNNDMMHGKGTYTVSDGCVYEGNFVKNVFTGVGIFTSVDKRILCGLWKDGALHGKGYGEYSNGNKYLGSFKQGLREGVGEMLFQTGAFFAGNFVQDSMNRGVFDLELKKLRMKKKGTKNNEKRSGTFYRVQFKDATHEKSEWVDITKKAIHKRSCCDAKSILGADTFLQKCDTYVKEVKKSLAEV